MGGTLAGAGGGRLKAPTSLRNPSATVMRQTLLANRTLQFASAFASAFEAIL